MFKKWLAEHKLKQIEKRLAEIEATQASVAVNSYRHQELEAERKDLVRVRVVTNDDLRKATAPSTPQQDEATERRRRFIDQCELEERQQKLRFIEKLEREGDHRQARLHRMDMLRIRERLELLYT